MGACFSAYDEYEADANRGNALAAMLKVEGFDVIIICCGTSHQCCVWWHTAKKDWLIPTSKELTEKSSRRRPW